MPARPRILIVDNDEGIRTIFKLNLKKHGYSVDAADCGEEALVKLEIRYFNLSLVDIKLPDIEGTELLKTMNEMYPDMVKIIVTGNPSMDNAIEALNNGADGYLIKPVKIDELIESIELHLEKQRKRKKLNERNVSELIENKAREMESMLKFHRPL
jgi:DNA-binding NtrC family response regulator